LLPRLLDEGIRRLDVVYTNALLRGILKPDPSLAWQEPELPADIAQQIEDANAALAVPVTPLPPPVTGAATTFTIQVDTPNAASVDQAELSVSRVPGVTSAITTSLALGGVSVMRVTYAGESASLQASLQAQGWSVSGSGSVLRIARGGPSPGPERE
jgi:hypothetical protein